MLWIVGKKPVKEGMWGSNFWGYVAWRKHKAWPLPFSPLWDTHHCPIAASLFLATAMEDQSICMAISTSPMTLFFLGTKGGEATQSLFRIEWVTKGSKKNIKQIALLSWYGHGFHSNILLLSSRRWGEGKRRKSPCLVLCHQQILEGMYALELFLSVGTSGLFCFKRFLFKSNRGQTDLISLGLSAIYKELVFFFFF